MALDWTKLLTEVRHRTSGTPLQAGDEDNAFLSDYYRVVFSSSFRRLQDKTQVTPLADTDYVRKRLTHSVEVATVGERMGRVVAKRVDRIGKAHAFAVGKIVATACLLHDIGNPPFGHKGEDAIGAWVNEHRGKLPTEGASNKRGLTEDDWRSLADLTRFDGNPQGFRIATRLHHHGEQHGMNLTAATLAATVKYPYRSANTKTPKDKFGCMRDDETALEWVWTQTGLEEGIRHPLTLIVEAADDIVNRLIDLEDALKLNYITYEQVRETLSSAGDLGTELLDVLDNRFELLGKTGPKSHRQQLAYQHFRVAATTKMTDACETVFVNRINDIEEGAFAGDLIKQSTASALYKALKKLEYDNIFGQSDIVRVEAGGIHAIEWLLGRIYRSISDDDDLAKTIPSTPRYVGESVTKVRKDVQRTIDYVSGMTDRYSITLYRQLRGISL